MGTTIIIIVELQGVVTGLIGVVKDLTTYVNHVAQTIGRSRGTLISLIIITKHMAVCGLSLHQGSTESRKTLEQKFIFQIGTLNPNGINERFSFNLFSCFSCYQAPTNSIAPSFCI